MSAKRIALIDDEPGVLKALQLLIGTFGVDVSTWSDPKAARSELCGEKLNSLDAVISDLRMPGIDGIELLSGLMIERPTLSCAIISGHASKEDVERANSLGISKVIRKPLGIDEIRKLLIELKLIS